MLLALGDGPLRVFELRDHIGGVSEKMLAETLRTLTCDGLLIRTVTPTIPPQVSYALSPLGSAPRSRRAEVAPRRGRADPGGDPRLARSPRRRRAGRPTGIRRAA